MFLLKNIEYFNSISGKHSERRFVSGHLPRHWPLRVLHLVWRHQQGVLQLLLPLQLVWEGCVCPNVCPLYFLCMSPPAQVSCNCVGCSSGPPQCSPPVGEILSAPSPGPVQETKPGLVTPDNLSVPSSLLPPVATEDSGLSSQIKEDLASIQISEDAANNFILNISNFSPGVVTGKQSIGLKTFMFA